MIPEVSYKHKAKQQKVFDKYRTKLLTAAAVLTFATPAAITVIQEGHFNPLAAIQAESGDDVSKEITGLEMKLVNSDGSDINDSKVNPYRQYNLYLKTQSNITIGSGRIEVGDFFYINVPEELDYTAVQQMVVDTNDFKYSIKVIEKDGKKQLRVEINDIMNLPINAFEIEMTLPVKFADTTNQEVTLTASTQGATSNEQTVTIQSREKSDISNQTDVALKVVEMTDAENFSEITSAVDPSTVLGLQLSFTFNTDDLMPGDTFTVELPKELEYVDGAVVNIARPEMQVAGKINGNDKTATFTVIRVPKGTGQAEAMGTTVAAPFDLLEIPINGGEVTLTATTAKNSASQKITISQASASRDVTASVKNLTFDLTDEDGNTVAQNAEVNPYKVYGMNINVDMGENAGVQQLKAGDYIDIELPDMMDIDINEIKKMINNTPNFESVGRIFNDDNGHKVLRTTITKVPRSISNTVTFGYKLFVPFNIEKILQIQDYNNTRDFSLKMKTTAQDNPKSIVLPLCVVNLGNPEVPAGDLYSPPSEFLFNNAGRTNEANILKPQYQTSQFLSKPRKADGSLNGKFYDYSIYTLVKIEKGHGKYGLQSRWTPGWDKVASNVDPTKKHWSASQGHPSEPDDSSVPNAGPENYINAYCIEDIKYRWIGDGLRPKVTASNGDYRYMQEDFETFFYKEVYNHISQNEKPEMAKKIKNIMAHSYPFVSEEAMRNYYGFEDDIKLSDIIAATQQYIWDLLYINNSEYAIPNTGAKIGRWDNYHSENMTVPFKNNQYTLDINSDQRVRSAWEKIGLKVNQGYTEKNIEKVKINKILLDDKKENVTIELSKKIDPSETGKLIITTPDGTKEVQLGYKPGYESGKIITTAVSGFDESKEHNFVDVRLELTDNDYLVKFYALHSIGGATQDVITTKIFPRTYTDQSSIKVNCFKGKFEFIKYQTGTQYTIVGAEFELTNQSTGEKFTAVADLEGLVSFDKLPSGTYTLKETKAPAGYILIEKEYTVVVGEDGNATLDGQNISEGIWNNKYEISNPEVKIELIKEDADKTHADNTNRLNGAVFRIDKENGAKEGYPKQYTTQGTGVNTGEIHITGLTDGTYTITEIKAPVGYQLSDEVITFTVNNGVVTRNNGEILNGKDAEKPELENKSMFFSNKPEKPKEPEIIVKKVDQNGDVLPAIEGEVNSGAEFTLRELQKKYGGKWGYIPDTEQQTRTLTIDTDGQLRFENLSKGVWYILSETKAPTDYEGTEKQWNVKVETNGSIEISEVAVKRVKTPAKNIKNADIQKITQLVNGLLPTLSQKPKSVIKEFKEEQVSIKEAKKQEAKIDGSTITIVNQKLGKFDIEKISTLKEKLTGAEFELIKKDDSSFTPIQKTTPKSGLLTFDNLLPGTYILTETKAPEGYEKTSETWEIKVTNNGETILLSETGEKIINTGADFSSGYNGILNMASKVMSIDTENKTFTQYIYVNNYKSNKVVWFGENHFKPVANIELPKFNNAETISYKIYKVPFGNVSELQSFEGTKTKEEFPSDSAIVSNINRYEGYTNLEVAFNTALSPKNSYYDANAAIIEVTAKYEGNEINTNNSFQYMLPAWEDKSMETREVSTTNYVKIPNLKSEEIIKVPLTIINKRPETPEPKPGEGKVVINKLGLGKPVAGAKFKLSYGKIGEIDTTKEPIYGVENNAGEIIFNQLKPGIYTLEEESAPEGYEKTDRTWTIIIYSSGVTEAFENPSNGSLQPEERTGSNRNSDLTVVKDNFTFTVYPYGDSNGSRDASTIYPNNGGLMDVDFELDFKSDTKKLLAGDYFTLDIPEYMHDHGINPANVNEHIIINGRKEPIAIGKMVDMDGNRVMKYTFTEYAASMKHIILKGNLKLSIDTSVVTDDASNKQYDFNLIDQKHIKGSINVEYPDFGTEYTNTISLMSTITQKDNKNQTFEYYIYVNPLKRTGNKGTTLEINDFRNDDPYVPGKDSVANITSIRLYDATNVELPKSFAVTPLIDKGTLKDLGKEYCTEPISKPNDGHTYTVDFENFLYNGKSYVVKVTGTMDSQGDYLALSSKLKGTYTQKDIWHNGYWYDGYWYDGYWENGYWEQKDLDNPTYLITNNHTYVRSSELAIIGHYKDNYPVLDIANAPINKAKIKVTKVDEKNPDKLIGFGDFDSARFAITTKPNPVSTNNGQNSDDIYNGQVANLIGNKGSSFTFENSDKQGFEPGQYYLWEMRAPKGYAKLLDVIPFYIEEDGSIIIPSKEIKQGDMVVGHEVDTEHFAYDMITQPTKVDDTPIFEIKVKNRKVEYPKTGSIGSIIFYVIGLTGMIGSAWMFTKKQ
ncbi:LPXTG-motif cell wall anchor domain-containing protein [Granulicatella balaenopterae]|uniref:LPXTG-motif cell wall anchor domain-containing protein n=1 Tax=Granulicatella balaenopterae TaxID=137733 RepID=A0A1H9I2P7_9LACT|nr:LPXTG-motif cell wall anchor domain-containing protein [Granulicatella balaenopterae]